MKKYFLILTILLLAYQTGFSQTNIYHPFPDSSATWNEIYYKDGVGGCYPDYCRYNYFMNGDTIINTQLYHKIFYNDSICTYYYGALRENNKRIYFHYSGCSHEILYYDFNFNVGDSIPILWAYCDSLNAMYMKVVSIDSVFLSDMTYRKKINFNFGNSWIEGVGDVTGLLYSKLFYSLCICWTELVCFKKNDTTFYLNETHEPCFDLPVSNNDLKNNSNLIIIYPNPSFNQFTLKFIRKVSKAQIKIYNLLGELKYTSTISSQETTIDIRDLAKGVYIVEVSTEKNVMREKFIKQ